MRGKEKLGQKHREDHESSAISSPREMLQKKPNPSIPQACTQLQTLRKAQTRPPQAVSPFYDIQNMLCSCTGAQGLCALPCSLGLAWTRGCDKCAGIFATQGCSPAHWGMSLSWSHMLLQLALLRSKANTTLHLLLSTLETKGTNHARLLGRPGCLSSIHDRHGFWVKTVHA